MKKLKLIYNPFAGDKSFKNNLDTSIQLFQQAGYDVHIFRSMIIGDIEEHISQLGEDEYHTIVISGGDGSVNMLVNSIMKFGIKTKVGIIPSGTANDFARFLKLDVETAPQVICNGKTRKIDIGLASGKYFINVCAAGLLSNVSQIVDANLKTVLGKFAYYVKGIEQLPNFTPLKMKITNSSEEQTQDLYWFTILNTSGTGGFDKISPRADIDDGLFDFIGFKAMPIHELGLLFVKMLRGYEYLDDKNIIYFKDNYFRVEYVGDTNPAIGILGTDLDGESGPPLPIEVTNLKQQLEIFIA